MFNWIPIEYYTAIYYLVMLFVVLFTAFHCVALKFDDPKNKLYLKFMGTCMVLFVVLYMGLRPINGVFVDMTTYASMFRRAQSDFTPIGSAGDILFGIYLYGCVKIMDVHSFFLLCTILYVIPLYLVCRKWFGKYYFYIFLALIVSFSFWAYGTNGIRNGIAGSLLLFAFSREKNVYKILFAILAVGMHKSMLLPLLGYLIAIFYNKPEKVFYFWILCIPLSLLGGTFFETFFASLGFDDRISYLTAGNINNDNFSSTGFRWDFLLYSSTAVFTGWFYIFKKNYKDKIYNTLFITYVFANAFWILVIRANFSNRFAYLSWFMIAIVIFYPLIKSPDMFKSPNWLYAKIILLYFTFTFIMNVECCTMHQKILTVFTPAYNRAYTLPALYKSLINQSNKGFKWLIIDDGSTDNTKILIDSWINDNALDVKYVYQENQGMVAAHNSAHYIMDTELCVCIDSDDFMPDNAVEKILTNWAKYGYTECAGMVGLDAYKNGEIIGTKLPEIRECKFSELYTKYKVNGDKKFIHNRKVFNKFLPYPRFENEKFPVTSYLYLLIEQEHNFLIFNEVFCIVEYMADGLSKNLINQYKTSPKSFAFYRIAKMRYALNYKERFKNAIHYVSSSIFVKNKSFLKESPYKLTTLLAMPFGILLHLYIKNTTSGIVNKKLNKK